MPRFSLKMPRFALQMPRFASLMPKFALEMHRFTAYTCHLVLVRDRVSQMSYETN